MKISATLIITLLICGAGFSWIATKEYYEIRYPELGDIKVMRVQADGYERARRCGAEMRAGLVDKDHAASADISYISCVEGVVKGTEQRRYQ